MTKSYEAQVRLLEIGDEMKKLVAEQVRLLAIVAKDAKPITMSSNMATKRERGMSVEQMDRQAEIERKFEGREIPNLRLADVLKVTGKTKRTIYRWMDDAAMSFPRPEIIRGIALWSEPDVKVWWQSHEGMVGRWPGA